MRGIEGEVEEEGTVFLPLDELAGFGAKEIGEVVGRLETLILPILQPCQFGAFPKGVHAAGNADELIEAAFVRWFELKAAEVIAAVPAAVATEMPFADVGGTIATRFEHVGQRGLLHPELVLLRQIDVVEDTEAGWEFPAHEAHARGHADGRDSVGAGEARALVGEPVEMRCGDVLAAVCTDVGIAHVVGEDNDKVGLFVWRIGSMDCSQRRKQQRREECDCAFHDQVV